MTLLTGSRKDFCRALQLSCLQDHMQGRCDSRALDVSRDPRWALALRGYRSTKEIRADYAAIAAVDDPLLRRRLRRCAPAGLRRVGPTPCA
jgi:hypothetical protein